MEMHPDYLLWVRVLLMAFNPKLYLAKFQAGSRDDISLVSREEQTKSSNSSICLELSFGEAPLLFLGETRLQRIVYFICANVIPRNPVVTV